MSISLQHCIDLDQRDPLKSCRNRFVLDPAKVYLDGNSLGALPTTASNSILRTVEKEWGQDLIESWNKAGWFQLTGVLGDRIGSMVGASAGQIVVCDNTSINLYKALHAALGINSARCRIIAQRNEFPTDLYTIQGVTDCFPRELSVELIDDQSEVENCLDKEVAVMLLSQVNYKSGKMLDMQEITAKAHQAGALVIWDLCHSAGVIPIQLDQWEVDFAVGCTYKYLNGGPGSPAFIYAAKRHHSMMRQPLTGWWGHASPFDFSVEYSPAEGIKLMLSGTQPILSMRGVGCGLDTFDQVSIDSIREKSMALCQLFIQLVRQNCAEYDLDIIGPENPQQRGSHVSIAFPHGYQVVQAMIEQGVTGDFRAPNLMRFGFAPLYIGYQQIWQGVEVLRKCLEQKVWENPKYDRVGSVT